MADSMLLAGTIPGLALRGLGRARLGPATSSHSNATTQMAGQIWLHSLQDLKGHDLERGAFQ